MNARIALAPVCLALLWNARAAAERPSYWQHQYSGPRFSLDDQPVTRPDWAWTPAPRASLQAVLRRDWSGRAKTGECPLIEELVRRRQEQLAAQHLSLISQFTVQDSEQWRQVWQDLKHEGPPPTVDFQKAAVCIVVVDAGDPNVIGLRPSLAGGVVGMATTFTTAMGVKPSTEYVYAAFVLEKVQPGTP